MARYLQDQNKVLHRIESGLYGATSGAGIWIGEVTEHSIDDSEGKLVNRYMGTTSRSFGQISNGPRDVTGTLTYNAQSFKFPFLAIGSVFSISGTNSTHTATQIDTDVRQNAFTSGTLNPPFSFTLEDSKQAVGTGRNFIRTVAGVVPNTTTISATQGEKIVVNLEYVAENLIASSGTTTSLTQDLTTPYLWDSASLTLGGSVISTAKSIEFEINQNIEAPHYLNGSRDISVPFPQNREYTLTVTMDQDSTNTDNTYMDLFKTNGSFNVTLDFNGTTTGSQHTTFIMSGCKIMSYDVPSANEGATESTMEIMAQDVSATAYESSVSSYTFVPY